jgi:hypothetical protein
MKDVLTNNFTIGDKVAVAFSYSRASVGYMRIGTVEIIDTAVTREEDVRLKIRWQDGQLSPWVKYGANTRWMKL